MMIEAVPRHHPSFLISIIFFFIVLPRREVVGGGRMGWMGWMVDG